MPSNHSLADSHGDRCRPADSQVARSPGRTTRQKVHAALTRSSTGTGDLRELESGPGLAAVRRRRASPGIDWSRILLPVAAVVVLVIVWQFYVSLGFKRRDLVPGPLDVLGQFGTLWAEGKLQEAVWTSLQRGLLGFLISVAIATPVGLLLAQVAPLRRAFGPLISGPAGAAVRGLGAGRHHLVRPHRRHGVLRGVHGRHPVDHQRADLRRGPDPAAVPQRGHGPGRVPAADGPADHPARGTARATSAASSRAGRSPGARSWPRKSSQWAAPSASASARC